MPAEAGGILHTRNTIGITNLDGTDANWENWRVKFEASAGLAKMAFHCIPSATVHFTKRKVRPDVILIISLHKLKWNVDAFGEATIGSEEYQKTLGIHKVTSKALQSAKMSHDAPLYQGCANRCQKLGYFHGGRRTTMFRWWQLLKIAVQPKMRLLGNGMHEHCGELARSAGSL